MSQKISPLNYAFAVGKVRALEKFLIKGEIFAQAVDAQAVDALRLFADSGRYSEALTQVNNSRQLEDVLRDELVRLKGLLSSLLLEEALVSLIRSDDLEGIAGSLPKLNSGFLRDYLRHLIDMHNIKTFLRLYLLKEPRERLVELLKQDGFIKKEDFFALYSQDLASFINRLAFVHKQDVIVDYAYFLAGAIRKLEKDRSFVSLERSINDFLVSALKPARYFTFGPEPLLAYYFAKVNEISLVRMIILAKLSRLSGGTVKERLNNVYA